LTKKTGALNKNKGFTKGELDYYDLDDDFIDDGDIAKNQQMGCFEIFIEDFNSFKGSLQEFKQSELYGNRLQELA
jgi:hypothetical protein